eukprot:15353532-Ditylum_brightwellii.AAC.1
MEECTDGAITIKKCISNGHPIYIESDDAVIKNAIEMKRNPFKRHKSNSTPQPFESSSSFVGVRLSERGVISRVLVKE